MVELVEREVGDQPGRVGEVGEPDDDVERVRRVRFDAPVELAAHRLDEMVTMQRCDRRVGGTDHVADRRLVAREHFVLGGAALAQRRFERAAEHRDLGLGDAPDGHAHDACSVERSVRPEDRFDGERGADHLDVDIGEAAVVVGWRRESPRAPQAQRVVRLHLGPRRDFADRQVPVGREQDLDRERLEPAALGRGVDLVDRRAQAQQAFDQSLLLAVSGHRFPHRSVTPTRQRRSQRPVGSDRPRTHY